MSEENKTDLDPVNVYRPALSSANAVPFNIGGVTLQPTLGHGASQKTPEEAAAEVTGQILHHMGLDETPNMAADLQAHIDEKQQDAKDLAEQMFPQQPPPTLPSYEEMLARRSDPYERAKAEQRERQQQDVGPEWSRNLAESKPSLSKVEYILEQGPCRLSGDAGAMARDALMAVQQVKRDNRRKCIRFWTGWLVFLLLVAGVAFGTWKVLPDYVVTGRYTVPSECSVPLGKGEITGTREYSYAYKSLFGYHLVDESTALEKTVVNIKGDRMTILGWDKATGKTWRQNIDVGEKGIAILKHADLYWFLTDKDMATVPYTGFCK